MSNYHEDFMRSMGYLTPLEGRNDRPVKKRYRIEYIGKNGIAYFVIPIVNGFTDWQNAKLYTL